MTYWFSLGSTRFQNSSKAIESKKAVMLTILPSRISMKPSVGVAVRLAVEGGGFTIEQCDDGVAVAVKGLEFS